MHALNNQMHFTISGSLVLFLQMAREKQLN
jgi:hypothetical protein